MGKSKSKGEKHVKDVCMALKEHLNEKDIDHYSLSVNKTVQFIVTRYRNIKHVQMKYDFKSPDFESDLKLTLTNGDIVNINLFSIDGSGKIQPKNPGAGSFLDTYFQQPALQTEFNKYKDIQYKEFLQEVISTKEKVELYSDIKQLKAKVNKLYPKFNEDINPLRRAFLFNLREYLFELLNEHKLTLEDCIEEAFKSLLLLKDINIITSYAQSDKVKVEQWQPNIDLSEQIELYRKGNDTVGIRKGQHALTLRLKFESSPGKSLKLATSYDLFPEETSRKAINLKSLEKFKKALSLKYPEPVKNDPNAIGKCNEALIYGAILENFPSIYQVDETEYRKMYEEHVLKVKEETISYLKNAATSGVEVIVKYLNNKYSTFFLESIQLVPKSYVSNKLDTADLKLTLKIGSKNIDEDFSLKAIARRGQVLTVKNPGVGTILGPMFFNCGSTEDIVDVTKSAFLAGQLNHQESLEQISTYIGEQLENASQQSLLKGLQAMLGTATTIVTYYTQLQSEYYDRHEIDGEIEVLPSDPTPINTKLKWNEGKEYITLRVKFGGGHHRGWTSVKLAVGYIVS